MILEEFRKSKKLNQKEMAKEIGVSTSYYYKIESGYQNPSYDFLVKLKERFSEVNINEMFFDKTKHQWERYSHWCLPEFLYPIFMQDIERKRYIYTR